MLRNVVYFLEKTILLPPTTADQNCALNPFLSILSTDQNFASICF